MEGQLNQGRNAKESPMTAEDSLSGAERRRAPRAAVLLRVEYSTGEELAADYVTDLGEGGIFIRTELDLEIGAPLSVSLSFPGLLEPTTIDCVVRWRRRAGPDTTPDQVGVGVEFVSAKTDQRERLAILVQQLRRSKPAPSVNEGTFRVLLVEDNTFVRDLFQHALLKFQVELANYASHDLLTAHTGIEALRVLENTKLDCVILDHYLPGITGCALVRRIRSMPGYENIPVLMISVGGNEVRREALASGATLYMDKPVLLTQLLDTLRALIFKERACH